MRRKLRLYPAISAAIAVSVTAIIAWAVNTNHRYQTEERLQVAADRIEQRVKNNILALKAIRGAFIANGTVPNQKFLSAVVRSLPERGGIGGAQGFGFAMATAPGDIETARYVIRQGYGIDRELFPKTDQPIRFPIILLEPNDERNRRALGFDMFADPVRREAMQHAAKTGLPAATGRVKLVQEGDAPPQSGFLLYVPVFKRDSLWIPGDATPGDVAGFVYSPVRVNDLIERVMSEEPPLRVALEVYSDAETPDNLMHSTNAEMRNPATFSIEIADRRWVLKVGEIEGRSRINPALIVWMIGLILAGAIGAFVFEHIKTVEATERLARETQRHAEQRDLLLGEMQHRIRNSIARMLALFRLTAREEKDRERLVKVFDDRLQAMARAQALIVGEQTEARSMADVISEEMRQWRRSTGLSIEGPDVMLQPSQVQAIGLILHELSTNALKYGALASGQPLSVRWSRKDETQAILLEWTETRGDVQTEPHISAGSGFGSRFMRMMVEGQLGGTYERSVNDQHFALSITFPETPPPSAH